MCIFVAFGTFATCFRGKKEARSDLGTGGFLGSSISSSATLGFLSRDLRFGCPYVLTGLICCNYEGGARLKAGFGGEHGGRKGGGDSSERDDGRRVSDDMGGTAVSRRVPGRHSLSHGAIVPPL